MHELGVTFYVVRDVKRVAEENSIDKIDFVTLEIGEVSGVIHNQLIDCWNWARKKETVTETAELNIETLEAITYCEDCKSEYRTVDSQMRQAIRLLWPKKLWKKLLLLNKPLFA